MLIRHRWTSFVIAVSFGLCSVPARAQTSPVPFVNQPLVPVSSVPGGPGFPLTVNGTGFVSTSVVYWNGGARTTNFVSGSQLTATISAADIAANGTVSVTVVTPAPGGGSSNIVYFPIHQPEATVGLIRYDLPTGLSSSSRAVVAADFNHDGLPDVAVVSQQTAVVGILLGKGKGVFEPHVDYAIANAATGLVAADFNGGGNLDLAALNLDVPTISILLGNANGTFQTQVSYEAGASPAALVAGDFNRDGKPDLAIANYNNGSVAVILGNGDGTFQSPTLSTAESGVVAIATGDFNGDGKLDLALANNILVTGSVGIMLGNGDGTFQPVVNYDAGIFPEALAIADYNGDGKLDLAVANDGGTVSILIGNGDGTFLPPVNYPTPSEAYGVATCDLNGDGKLDLALGDNAGKAVSVLLGNGDGTFQPSSNTGIGPTDLGASIACADFNGDGRLDLALATLDDTVAVLLQTSAGPAASVSPTALQFGDQVVGTTSAPQSVTLNNTGTAPLDILRINVGPGPLSFVDESECGATLAAGASCTITVQFMPIQQFYVFNYLTISDNAAGSPQTVTLIGSGLPVSANPVSLTFASQPVGTTSQPQSVLVTNSSRNSYATDGVRIDGPASHSFGETDDCGSIIAPGESCTISVTFTPSSQGPQSAVVVIGHALTVPLTGTGG